MGENQQYDIVIVGAGPAGLSAARTTARLGFSTLVLERSDEAGQLAHPCSAILAPMPGFVQGRRLLGDLFYPQLDLLIPLSLVVGYPRFHRFISPGGFEVEAPFSRGDGSPVAAIDKGGLLQLLAEQAGRAGAELRYGTEATGLLIENGQICGVRSSSGDIRAALVMAAEGAGRRLSRAAGLFPRSSTAARHALILSRELVAPAVRRQHLGQITTFGKQYSSAPQGFGTVVMPIPGCASVYYTVFSDGPDYYSPESAQYYLEEYMTEDPRVRDFLAGAETTHESSYSIAINEGPVRVARSGFLSLGDAATPAGHVGVLGAMWLGRNAAFVAAEALDMHDVSAERLSMYGYLFHNKVLRVLRSDRKLMLGLAEMPDADLDRLAQILAGLPMVAPFFTGWHGAPWEAVRWLARHYPQSTSEGGLLRRILDRDTEQRGHPADVATPGLFPASMQTGAARS